VDFIIEGSQGLIPIEIKSGTKIDPRELKHLKSFIEEYNCNYGIIINNSDRITRLSEKIIQIPAIYL
jgi:uncharacterized protein